MNKTRDFKVLIAGGSIAGLVLANILEQYGIDFLVLEAYPEIAPQVGASLGLFPNGTRILDQLGLYEGVRAKADGMSELNLRGPDGKRLGEAVEDPARHFVERYGVHAMFLDRQMAIQVFYDNLKDKTKVLVNKRVVEVKHLASGVRVTTKDGSSYTGDILVGADGIHSTIRREMWRLSDELSPEYFPQSDRTGVSADYCCLFGISTSDGIEGFVEYSSHMISNYNFSYLVAGGPERQIYWFLFVRFDRTLYGLENDIPRRFTEKEVEELASKHTNDRITESVTFGQLYHNRKSAILTSLPEHVFQKWYFGRIITIGDAAHKFNPICGQGGNGAIETAAALGNELLRMLRAQQGNGTPTEADITTVFQKTQEIRRERVANIIKGGHEQQRLMAMETPFLRFIAKNVVPRGGLEAQMGIFADTAIPAVRLDMLPMPRRRHLEPYADELPANRLGGQKISMTLAAIAFATLTYVAASIDAGSSALLGWTGKKSYTEPEPRDWALSSMTASLDLARTPDYIYLLSLRLTAFIVWAVEGCRNGNSGSIVSWPTIWSILCQFIGLPVTIPLYFLVSVWTTSYATYSRAVGRPIPPAAAKALTPSVALADHGYLQYGGAHLRWGLAHATTRLVQLFEEPSPFDIYTKKDVAATKGAYLFAFLIGAIKHLVFVAYSTISLSPMSWPRVLGELPGTIIICAVSTMLWCLFSIYELRRLGYITTDRAVVASLTVIVGNFLVGPGATYAATWFYREDVLAQLGKSDGE